MERAGWSDDACYADPAMAMSAQHDRRRALYDAYRTVPEHERAEIIDGVLYVSPQPGPWHANATSVLGGELNGAFQRGRGCPGGWWILHGPELQLVDLEPMVPDLAGWRVERMPTLPETAHFAVPPDWICEVLARPTEAVDRDKKLPLYARHGVRHVWLVDPIAQLLEVHTLDDDHRWREVRIFEGDFHVRAEPFATVELDLSALWVH
jgi:Uma2 family endonuclease